MSNKQQTAVQWLQEQIETQRMQCNNEWQCGYQKALNEVIFLLTQAKAMEKEQMIDAFWNGDNSDCTSEQNSFEFAEQYYKETYEK